MFCLVLHSHLPWLANHGRWPVGEEWLYQSWASCYLPLAEVLRDLADEGYERSLTLGMTPVLSAQLDDPHCLRGMHHWLGNWKLRAHEAAGFGRDADAGTDGPPPATADDPASVRAAGRREFVEASHRLAQFEEGWLTGSSPVLRGLAEDGVVELLGGPLAHPFQPLLDADLREFSLAEGLAETTRRFGLRPRGIWAPECAFAPGMEDLYAGLGIGHFMVDGPSLHGDTALGHPVGDSGVVAFGRDLTVSYRVWSPKSGYPGDAAYRDFHAMHHGTGFKHARVTGRKVPAGEKAPYDPERIDAALRRDVEDFVATVRERLESESRRIGRDALVVAAFDTELFGHWWYEGPRWLAAVLRALPEAGIRVGTLSDAVDAGFVGAPVELPASSWGSGKDWRVWEGPAVEDIVRLNAEVVETARASVRLRRERAVADDGILLRDAVADQILREALMCVQSDWAFLISKDTAAGYARDRAHLHAHACREICTASDRGDETEARRLASAWRRADGAFGGLDSRRLLMSSGRHRR